MSMPETATARTWWGDLLCRVRRHRWKSTGTRTTVIPTGNALMIRTRTEREVCARGCGAIREHTYERRETRR